MTMAPPNMMARMRGATRQRGQPLQPNPAAFNRLARLQRQQIGAIPYAANVSGKILELPNVGYHYRCFVQFDLDAGTTIGSPTGKFLSGANGASTNRFMCPLGIARRLQYTLNISSPIYTTDGYGNYIMQLLNNRGRDPYAQVAVSETGRATKEFLPFAIFDATNSALKKPDQAVGGSVNYKFRACYVIGLTLGEAATAGLIPVQDIRISPQIILDMGDMTDLVSATADFGASNPLTGNFNCFIDYFTVPDDSVRPDTDFVMQTRQDTISIAGVGSGANVYRPQIGGIILRAVLTLWSNSKAPNPTWIDATRLRIQQSIELEKLTPQIRIMDERRWYTKELPDEVYPYDHIAGFGDPTLPSLRDRVASNQLTRLEYYADLNANFTVSGTTEQRNYLQQLIPLPRV